MRRLLHVRLLFLLCLALYPSSAHAQVERLCDPGAEDCRQILINYIRAEQAGLDVAFWFMEDSWIASEIIARHRAGVPVRVLMDTEANASTPRNADRLGELRAAGIPMREKVSSGILHWKMILFSGQGIVEFSGANFSSDAWVYSGAPYTNYVDEAIYFTGDPAVVNSFRTKFDDLWTNTTGYANYANVSGPLLRRYDRYSIDPELNFAPLQSFAERAVNHYQLEQQKLDVIIYRITDQRHTNAVGAAAQRGVQVRLITEPLQYRDPRRLWHSWNTDRLYMAGVQIRNRTHTGLNHQKLTLHYSQGLSSLGSSNWTTPSDNAQEEHNYFTAKPHLFTWLVDQFERKWNNSTGLSETGPFTPLPPDAAVAPAPANGTTAVPTTGVVLKWNGGYWAHNYDIYFGTAPDPPLLTSNQMLGPSQSDGDLKQYALPMTLNSGTTYYWRIVSKTMAHVASSSAVWSFTTSGSAASASARVLSSYPVPNTAAGEVARLWSHVQNTGAAALPSTAKVWFFVNGPGWSGSNWVGQVSVAGLAAGGDRWLAFDWPVPPQAQPGSYTFWSRVYSPDSTPISEWSPGQTFTISSSARVTITAVAPVSSAVRGGPAVLWAKVRNDAATKPPTGSTVWFWVNGPGWEGSNWVGSARIDSLSPGKEQWFSFTWTVPDKARAGTYYYWAQAWSPNGVISPWSAGQEFVVR